MIGLASSDPRCALTNDAAIEMCALFTAIFDQMREGKSIDYAEMAIMRTLAARGNRLAEAVSSAMCEPGISTERLRDDIGHGCGYAKEATQ